MGCYGHRIAGTVAQVEQYDILVASDSEGNRRAWTCEIGLSAKSADGDSEERAGGWSVVDFEEAVREPGPYLLNIRVTPFENVYPMVPAGGAINEMVLGAPQPVEA